MLARCVKKTLLIALSLGISLLLVELMMAALTALRVIPSFKQLNAEKLRDPQLGYRLQPYSLPELDGNGFRNPSVPARADIVAIGDSLTYGYNAESADSWIYQLGRKLNVPVYNISIGGGGPPQYALLFDQALTFDPKTVVIGFYLGNDVLGACHSFKILPFWQDYARERRLDITDCSEASEAFFGDETGEEPGVAGRILTAVKHSYLVSFLKHVEPLRNIVWKRRAQQLSGNDNFLLVEDSRFDTLLHFTPERFDMNLPAIRSGMELNKFLFAEMRDKLSDDQKLMVVVIPTKENVFYDYLSAHRSELPPAYADMARLERAMSQQLVSDFAALGITAVDALPFLEEKIFAENPPLYLKFAQDGHPTEVGYGAIADAVMSAL